MHETYSVYFEHAFLDQLRDTYDEDKIYEINSPSQPVLC